jgi:SagB-type dehydrogenase family enzyme
LETIRQTLAYHRRTKHHLHRYAASAGHLDWATQPEPFRTYDGAAVVALPLLADAIQATYTDLYRPGAVAPRRLDANAVAVLFELALGLSAWKEYKGSRWALRCNPSSGNLHPTEGYAVVPSMPGLEAGVYHYVSRDHCLERRCGVEVKLPANSLLVGLSSIHWREAWKYGERAFRYCQHDVGHALASIRYAAAALGWSARLLDQLSDDEVSAFLGLDQADAFAKVDVLDREHPDLLLLVGPSPLPPLRPPALSGAVWSGTANALSPNHVHWEVIDVVAEATRKPGTAAETPYTPEPLPPLPIDSDLSAATLIRRRRSCLALDGKTGVDRATFFRMLDHLLPRHDVPPWDALPWAPQLHAGLFVHRVHGLPPGLYFLERDARVHESLQAACRDTFAWQRVPDAPEHLRLYLLAEGDLRQVAQTVSCHQEIAADGAFSLGMIAEFGDRIREKGAWWYRRLFWEAGVLGHVLYLEAEAAGIRSTGIGCYFDDVYHDLLGLTGDRFQDLYHFTVGTPVEDARLRTIAPYAHLTTRG